MNILKRTKLDTPVNVGPGKYISAICDGPSGEQVIVRTAIETPLIIEEIVLFEDTFEGRPAVGGLFVGRAP